MAVTDEIKARIDIVELIGESVQLRKAGRNFVGFCPFHSNTRTPAFTVYPENQSYHCFGCKASGTIFDFVMQRQGLDFPQALKQLAERAGVKLEERGEAEQQLSRQRTRLLELNSAAAIFFQHLLRNSQRGEAGREYLERRGLDAEAVESFQLGYAPDEWSLLLQYLTEHKGFSADEVELAGLAIKRDSGGHYDRFRGRLMFPIRDMQSQIVGFGGRALGDTQPKYMNTPQTPLFDKSEVLYGLDLARESIRSQSAAVIVEGYVDVITAHRYGFRNVVAPLGTALSDSHVKQLKRFASRLYLALDADAAGQRAMLKGLEKIQASTDQEHARAVATPIGVVRWEADIELRIIALPDGRDPDEVIKQSPDLWSQLVAAAQPVMEFYIQAYTAGLDLSNVRNQTTVLERLLPLINQLEEVERRAYLGKLEQILPDLKTELYLHAQRPKVDPQQIARREIQARVGKSLRAAAEPKQAAQAEPAAPARRADPPGAEEHLLGLLLRHPPARTAIEELLITDLAAYPLVRQLIKGTIGELFERLENRLLWESWSTQPPERLVGGWLATQPDELRDQGMRVVALVPLDKASYRDTRAALDTASRVRLRLVQQWQFRLARQIADSADPAEQQRLTGLLIELQHDYLPRITNPPRSSTYDDLRKHKA